ncbi:EXLDI protein [Nocardia altamirensis]|uniref:EXLDI protein n=1 Tax=Nocardia TaxID=1817 RepID=UPI00084062AE|nr:EXLDI protein [Nocardia altamirensis]
MENESTQVGAVVELTKGDEYPEVELKVGPGGRRRQRFAGRLVGESRQFTKEGLEAFRVYLSKKGKYAVHRQSAEWSDYSVVTTLIKDWKNWRNVLDLDDLGWGDYTLEVVDSLDELRERVPAKVYRAVVDVTEHPSVEDLDI